MENISILVVEDSRIFANIIRREILSKLGFKTVIATSLKDAKDLIERKKTDFFLAILDLNLPDAQEDQVVEYILSQKIPSIVFTSNIDDTTRERIQGHDVVDYVLKESSQDVDYLIRTIRRIYNNQSIKALVVDDSKVSRTSLRLLLETHKINVLEANNGKKGLEKLHKNPETKIIIVDYHMPEMDGFQFVAQVRRKYPPDQLAIIGISAHGSPLMSAKFLKKGANDFIVKPFVKEEFYCRLNQNIDMLEYIKTIQEASHKDFLTGLYNRRYFFELSKKIFANAKRGNLSITIAMIDIDHFKQINDAYGHDAGDTALKAVAQIISDNRRASDVVARFGGEEFCILLVNMEKDKTTEFFEKLRQSIQKKAIQTENIDISLTISIGVTTKIGKTLEETINRADELMYNAKQLGRNRVVVD